MALEVFAPCIWRYHDQEHCRLNRRRMASGYDVARRWPSGFPQRSEMQHNIKRRAARPEIGFVPSMTESGASQRQKLAILHKL